MLVSITCARNWHVAFAHRTGMTLSHTECVESAIHHVHAICTIHLMNFVSTDDATFQMTWQSRKQRWIKFQVRNETINVRLLRILLPNENRNECVCHLSHDILMALNCIQLQAAPRHTFIKSEYWMAEVARRSLLAQGWTNARRNPYRI